jgi:uncharacterized protein (DUF1501 family)
MGLGPWVWIMGSGAPSPRRVARSAGVCRGSLIPTTAVDQYAATLAQWFGVAQGSLSSVLPNVNNFAVQNLGFLG